MRRPVRHAALAALAYAAVSASYIFLSDWAAATLAATKRHLPFIGIVKGLGFVLITSVTLFLILRSYRRGLGIARDITPQIGEKENHRHAIEAERQRLFSLLEELPAYVYLLGRDHTIRFANRRFRELFGEPGHHKCYEIIAGRHTPCEPCPTFRVLETGKPELWEWEQGLCDRVFEIVGCTFTDPGGEQLALEMGIDITDRKAAEKALRESEKRFRAVLDNSPFPTAVVDEEDDRIYFWSRSAIELFGHAPKTTVEWYAMTYPDPEHQKQVLAQWKPGLAKARESGHPVNTGEYQVTCADGTVRTCELYATFVAGHLIVTFNDITERKTAEQELASHHEHLEQEVRKRTRELRKIVNLMAGR